MDLSTGCNFDLSADRRKAVERIRAGKPTLVIGSPPCTVFSRLQTLNVNKQSPEWRAEYEIRKEQAIRHVQFCIKLYRLQLAEGRYLLHEHPAYASSWKLDSMEELAREQGVWSARADLCMLGLTTTKDGAEGPAMKPTRFL